MKKKSLRHTQREAFRLESEDATILRLLSKVRDQGNKSRYLRRTLNEGLLQLLPCVDDTWSSEELERMINRAERSISLRDQAAYRELTNELPARAAQWLGMFHGAVAALADDLFSDSAKKTYRIAMQNYPEDLQ